VLSQVKVFFASFFFKKKKGFDLDLDFALSELRGAFIMFFNGRWGNEKFALVGILVMSLGVQGALIWVLALGLILVLLILATGRR